MNHCRDCESAYLRKKYAENPEPKKAHALRWAKENAERHLELTRRWADANRSKQRAAEKTWRTANPDHCRNKCYRRRARVQKEGGLIKREQWERLKERYRHKCLWCGKAEPDIRLTLDHVVPLSLGGSNTIENVQPLCRSCNSSKGAKTIDFRNANQEDSKTVNHCYSFSKCADKDSSSKSGITASTR